MKYSELCQTYEELEKNPSRLKKIEILSDFLKKLKKEDNKEIIYLVKGKVFPDYSNKEIGISDKLVVKALSKASGLSDKEIINKWRKIGDLGKVSEDIMKVKKQHTLFSKTLNVEKVLENIRKLPELEGKGTIEKKMSLISELLTSANSLEAKYLIRTLLSDLRIGVSDGTLRDALVKACFSESELKEDKKEITDNVQNIYDTSSDWKQVFEKACKGVQAVKKTVLEPGKPIKVMLFLKENSISDGFKRVGKPALIDYKYDGFRMLINKDESGEISIFTRRLDNVTKQFPEVVEYVRKYVSGKSFMLDSEAVGYDLKTKKY